MSSSQSPQQAECAIGGYVLSRRRFVAALGAGWATTALTSAGVALAQQPGVPVESPSPNQVTGAPITSPETPGASMEGDGYRPVRRPPKPGAQPSMDAQARDDLEHKISCPCPCTLDVFTCRTSMPTCGFSPRMHRDVIALIEGGHSGEEILRAFESAYGEEALMAPKRAGFNLVGYLLPFAALGTGAAVIAGFIRKWGRRAPAPAAVTPLRVDANAEELARLDAAIRGDSR